MKKTLLFVLVPVVVSMFLVTSIPASAVQSREISITGYTDQEEALREYARITGKDIDELRKTIQRSREDREQAPSRAPSSGYSNSSIMTNQDKSPIIAGMYGFDIWNISPTCGGPGDAYGLFSTEYGTGTAQFWGSETWAGNWGCYADDCLFIASADLRFGDFVSTFVVQGPLTTFIDIEDVWCTGYT